MRRPWLDGNNNRFEVRKLAHIARLKARIGWQNLRTEEFIDDGPFCVTGTDFINGEVNWDTSYHVSPERYEIDANIHLQEQDLLITKDGTIGKVAVVRDMPSQATLNSGVFLLRPQGEGVNTTFMKWIVQSKVFDDFVTYNSTGSTINHLYQNVFEQFRFPYPDPATQKAIADFLDRETTRIDQLIEKKQRFLSLTARRIDALVDEAISDPTLPRLRFENVVRRMQRPVVLSEHDELVRLGLYNRGRGIFKKPAADEEGMGDSSFFFVRQGDLILSGQFAWEGAVALATEDEAGCVVSHRYPVFRGKDGINTAYLLGLLRSGFGDFILNESSRGSAGRNRPLNTWRLGKEKIPIPPPELQEAIDHALAFERQLKKKTEQSIALLSEARAALITAAVTGQIDVATWGQDGNVDRRLDKIEEEKSLREARA